MLLGSQHLSHTLGPDTCGKRVPVNRPSYRARREPSAELRACEALESRSLLAGTGGLFGQYYDNADFTNLSFTRTDPGVHFNWQARAPLSRLGATTYSARWIGQIKSADAGTYSFNIDTDGTAALRVRGQLLTLSPSATGTSSATIFLPANQAVDFQLDYSHQAGNARINLDWTPPGQASPSAIPAERLLNTFAPEPATMTNPVIGTGADPWVFQYQDEYVYVWSDGGRIWGSRSARLQDIGTAPAVLLYTAPNTGDHSRNVWAPELHQLDGKWYLYFAADDGNNANHRMFVASRTAADPLGTFTYSARLSPTTDRWAIDGTVLEYSGSRYFIWSGWPGTTDGQQNLYIARMASPTALTGERVVIAQPTAAWERNGLPINEGPEVFQRNGETHVIYSGSGYWTNGYALGDLKLTGTNPMLASNWTKAAGPVFSQANGVTGVGHASFTKSPDGTEDWIVYHAHKFADSFNDDRVVRAQKFTVNGGTPIFGAPVANSTAIDEPAGTPTYVVSSSTGFLRTQSTRFSGILIGEKQTSGRSIDFLTEPAAFSFTAPALKRR